MAKGKKIAQDIALQRAKYPHLSDEAFRFMVQQIAGRERLREKLPTITAQEEWWFPAGLACEQCSSEQTAWYKVQCLQEKAPFDTFVDLTGGYGVDSFFLSSLAKEGHYVEQDEALCRIAAHNFSLSRPHITVHNTTAEEYLNGLADSPLSTLLYIDPARRGTGGNKVFRLEDCTPNVVALLPQLLSKSSLLMMKLSPMLDITAALRALGGRFDVHVVAVHNEVKELLLLCKQTEQETAYITAVNITGTIAAPQVQRLCFTYEDERGAEVQYLPADSLPRYLYEPNAALTKACAFRYVSAHFRLQKLAPNTHLYASSVLLPDFPGRVWEVAQTLSSRDTKHALLQILSDQGNAKGCAVLTRNYPMNAEQLRRKLGVPDDDTWYAIGARVGNKPTLYLARRVR